ncbi:hypothetical protein OsI_21356 [Oryza sativa Indica Group]|uniref:Disease resistance N-terminal domain-containing protein n=1 Tax=Oryza sativa subsp. indica TaxID=39946 RepID=A2Y8H7_ORYSI|nr:hypothetical protein OsI_21356 [Oryza sativa Indica Group]
MADSTVGFVVGRLAEFVAKEAKVLQGVERDVVLLRDKLADQRRRLNVDVWVQQTRDVSLEVEDVIDRFMVRVNLDQHLPLWSKCLKFLTACATQVNRHDHSKAEPDLQAQERLHPQVLFTNPTGSLDARN